MQIEEQEEKAKLIEDKLDVCDNNSKTELISNKIKATLNVLSTLFTPKNK